MNPADRVIVPLDVSSLEQAIGLLDQLPQATFWKVGLELFVSIGSPILVELQARQKRIFLDLKFHDIPNTVAGACRAAASYGVDLVTVHAAAGRKALQVAQTAATEGAIAAGHKPPTLLAITLLTSLSSRDLAFDLKIPLELPEYVLQMALLAQESGLGGLVCSPQEATQLRQICAPDTVLVCPGVRPDWAEAGDQQRIFTPAAALKAGATYLVIGRPITQAAEPATAFNRICDELATVL
ncbi:MAG TPA: orotidine-5'-phosphate decarboxylase [Leptolyngbyaceae cyanobacterium M33_DOE_097]|uniref:Orotidine 5'-phosphate decarboxylase n=1 Tax=Oscillatoriales cyanobacterium SpSt-418 TaxID=2282169 RepID=A0A7C3KH61_9CYAN|nr:orotidine-5'-phosphate decarboxylase [Leptolyngbyaceae cyanobacterium M33_DOE_097]